MPLQHQTCDTSSFPCHILPNISSLSSLSSASAADASSILSILLPLNRSTILDLGVVYNRYPFPPSSPAKSSCDHYPDPQLSLSFWQASSQIRVAPPLAAAAAALFARHMRALDQQAEDVGGGAQGGGSGALCLHWRRADFKTYPTRTTTPACLPSSSLPSSHPLHAMTSCRQGTVPPCRP